MACFRVLCASARMDDVSGLLEQLPLALCLVGEQLLRDQQFQAVCTGFNVPVKYCSSSGFYIDPLLYTSF